MMLTAEQLQRIKSMFGDYPLVEGWTVGMLCDILLGTLV